MIRKKNERRHYLPQPTDSTRAGNDFSTLQCSPQYKHHHTHHLTHGSAHRRHSNTAKGRKVTQEERAPLGSGFLCSMSIFCLLISPATLVLYLGIGNVDYRSIDLPVDTSQQGFQNLPSPFQIWLCLLFVLKRKRNFGISFLIPLACIRLQLKAIPVLSSMCNGHH